MITYAIRIDGRYFKDYVYAQRSPRMGYLGHTRFGTTIQEGDIIDIVTTPTPERTEVKRSLGGTIATIYAIDKLRNKKIEIIPIQGDKSK